MENKINWNEYANSYDLMCEFLPEYQELISKTTTTLSKLLINSKNINITEIGSGTGNVTLKLAAKFSESKINSLELIPEFLEIQNKKIIKNNLENKINLIQGDVRNLNNLLNDDESDLIVMYHVLNFLNDNERDEVLKNIWKKTKIGGYFAIADIGRKIPVENWSKDILKEIIKSKGDKNIKYYKNKLEPAITANKIALERQKLGFSYMHNLEEFEEYISNFGFQTVYKTDKFYRGIDDFLILKKLPAKFN